MQVAITALTHVHVHPRGLQLGSRVLQAYYKRAVKRTTSALGSRVLQARTYVILMCTLLYLLVVLAGGRVTVLLVSDYS